MIESIQQYHAENGVFIKSIIAGTLVAAACGLMGCFIILRRLSFLSDALAHAMLTGVIGGYLLIKILFGTEPEVPAMVIGALLSGIVTVMMISFVTRVSRIKQDTAIGIMYTGIFAIGGFVLSMKAFGRFIHKDLYHLIIGDVLAVSNSELWMLAVILIIVFAFVTLFFRHLQLTSFDPVMAAAIGIPVLAIEYGLTICTSLVVVGGVTIVGVILVVALMITPAAAAYLLFDRLKPMLVASALIGVISFWLGYLVAYYAGVAPGSAVVVTLTLIFLIVLVVAPKYGLIADWLRKRQMVPQPIVEDILGSILKAKDHRDLETNVLNNVGGSRGRITSAIRKLVRQEMLQLKDGFLALTDKGHKEAVRLRRAHRLWETYLQQTGTPDEKLHEKAHVLEHVHDRTALDYLDDKLGHPIQDPHGSEIPEDEMVLKSGQLVLLSKLRKGHQGRIVTLGKSLADLPLAEGAVVIVGPRQDNGQIWTVTTPESETLRLTHDQADEIKVEIVDLQSESS